MLKINGLHVPTNNLTYNQYNSTKQKPLESKKETIQKNTITLKTTENKKIDLYLGNLKFNDKTSIQNSYIQSLLEFETTHSENKLRDIFKLIQNASKQLIPLIMQNNIIKGFNNHIKKSKLTSTLLVQLIITLLTILEKNAHALTIISTQKKLPKYYQHLQKIQQKLLKTLFEIISEKNCFLHESNTYKVIENQLKTTIKQGDSQTKNIAEILISTAKNNNKQT